jgi:DNA-binding HxlR family transcriptional regulator
MTEGLGHGPFSSTFHRASELVGKRWTGAIIFAVLHGKTRFVEIADVIPGISDRLLTERLKELVDAGVLKKRQAAQGEASAGYHLTPKGMALRSVLIALYQWATAWEAQPPVVDETAQDQNNAP